MLCDMAQVLMETIVLVPKTATTHAMDINGRVSNAGTCVTKLYVADSSKGGSKLTTALNYMHI